MLEIDKVYQGDCLELMKQIEDKSVDLVFADPPFNIKKPYQDDRDNYKEWCSDWIRECFRALKEAGSFYLMTLTRHLEWKMPIMSHYGIFINVISWRNVSASHGKRSFWFEYQPIMLYGKTDKYIFNTYAQTDYEALVKYGDFRKSWRWGGYSTEYKGQLKDRWDDIPFVYAGSIHHPEAIIEQGTNRKSHPCQMPEGLAKRAIEFSTNEGAIVMDPFLGSGTTAVVCINTNRHYIGMELSPEYCAISEKRIAEAIADKKERDRQIEMWPKRL